MPRPNKPRTIEAEAALARRIAYERERLGMSYEGLAGRMTKAGCPIQASGLYKIEKAGRRITVDELVGLADVFGMSVSDLLQPIEMVLHGEIARAEQAEYDAAFEQWRATERLFEARQARADLYRKSGMDATLGEALDGYWREIHAQRVEAAKRQPKGRLAKLLADHEADRKAMSKSERAEADRRASVEHRLEEAMGDLYEVIRDLADPDGLLGDS